MTGPDPAGQQDTFHTFDPPPWALRNGDDTAFGAGSPPDPPHADPGHRPDTPPSPRPRPTAPTDAGPPPGPRAADEPWSGESTGGFVPFQVGDPGRAATVRAYPDPENWDVRDTVLDGVQLLDSRGVAALELRAASARGRAHRYQARVRQDAYAFRSDGTFLVAAVADGVSSGVLSHVAANIVSQHGCHMIAKKLEHVTPAELDWTDLLRVLATKVINAGRRRLSPPGGSGADELPTEEIARHLSTTALFAVVGLDPVDGLHPVQLFAYGDTSAWILRFGRRWEPQQAVKNDGAAVASSATDALPFFPQQAPPATFAHLAATDTLVLVSDGIGDPLGDGTGPVGAFLATHWHRPPEPLEFAAQVDFARRSHDDDRTAVAIWPIPGR